MASVNNRIENYYESSMTDTADKKIVRKNKKRLSWWLCVLIGALLGSTVYWLDYSWFLGLFS